MTGNVERRNEWNETLEETIERSKVQGGLLVYSMIRGETLKVGINGVTPEGITVEQSRNLTAIATGLHGGVLEVVEDTAEEDNWLGQKICLGTVAYSFAGIKFIAGGLLRGMISHHGGVAVDLTAQHFVGDTPPQFLMAEYETLFLEDEMIF